MANAIIRSAKFVAPHVKDWVFIEMWVNHDGVAGNRVVACEANTKTYALRQFAGVRDGQSGEALISYLSASTKSGKLHAAINHARAQGW